MCCCFTPLVDVCISSIVCAYGVLSFFLDAILCRFVLSHMRELHSSQVLLSIENANRKVRKADLLCRYCLGMIVVFCAFLSLMKLSGSLIGLFKKIFEVTFQNLNIYVCFQLLRPDIASVHLHQIIFWRPYSVFFGFFCKQNRGYRYFVLSRQCVSLPPQLFLNALCYHKKWLQHSVSGTHCEFNITKAKAILFLLFFGRSIFLLRLFPSRCQRSTHSLGQLSSRLDSLSSMTISSLRCEIKIENECLHKNTFQERWFTAGSGWGMKCVRVCEREKLQKRPNRD